MIVYALACGEGHFFEGWFASGEACNEQAAAGQIACPTCASTAIRRLPSAPYVKGSSGAEAAVQAAQAEGLRREVLASLRKYIVENTEDVGRRFPEIARRIHYGEEKARGIRGRVTPQEGVDLHEEGIAAQALAPGILPAEEIH